MTTEQSNQGNAKYVGALEDYERQLIASTRQLAGATVEAGKVYQAAVEASIKFSFDQWRTLVTQSSQGGAEE